MARSGFWIRAAATGIDAIVFLVFVATIGVTALVLEARGELTEAKQRGFEALLLVLWLAYSSMEAMVGATAGKFAAGIIITLPNGAPAPPWTRFLRWSTKQFGIGLMLIWVLSDQPLFYVIGGLVNLVILIGCLRAMGEEKLTWHDLWAHTAVVPRGRAAQMRDVREEAVGSPTPT